MMGVTTHGTGVGTVLSQGLDRAQANVEKEADVLAIGSLKVAQSQGGTVSRWHSLKVAQSQGGHFSK